MTDVLSRNLFDLLGDDSGDGVAVAKKAAPAQTQPAPKSAAPASTSAAPADKKGGLRGPKKDGEKRGNGSFRGKGDGERRGGRGRPDGERRPRRDENGTDAPRERNVIPRFNRENADGSVQPSAEDGFERKENSRGGYRGREQRGGFRGPRQPRDTDRHNKADWVDGEKKEVAGKGTWGDEVKAQEEELTAPAVDAAPEIAANAEPKEPEELEPVVKSFEQYQAELATKRSALSSVAVRAPIEKVEGKWASAVVYEREDEEEFIFAGQTEKKKKVKEVKKTEKIALEIEQRFSDEGRRGERGGRGRGGEKRGRGSDRPRGGRGGKQQQPYLNVQDEAAFPSLSK